MTRKQLGAELLRIRKAKKLSAYAVEKLTGVTITQIRHIEAGTKAYTIDSLLKLSQGYGVKIELKH